jgi:dynactin-6
VRVGEGCVVWERAVVGRPARDDGEAEEEEGGGECVLERNVVVESGAVVRAKSVGEGSVVDVGAVVGDGAVLGKVRSPNPPLSPLCPFYQSLTWGQFCRIAPRAVVAPGAVLADRSVVWAAGAVRVDEARADAAVAEIRERGHAKMLKSLQALVPSKASNWQ